MILSHLHKFIYIAVPKTGTTSVQKQLESTNIKGIRIFNLVGHEGWTTEDRFRKHIPVVDLKNHINKFDQYFKFGFSRNPWDLMVSWYAYRQRPNALISTRGMSLSEFIKKTDMGMQHTYFFDEIGNNLMDFIGKTENLQEDLNIICDKIGIPNQQLPHKNKSKHKHYTEYYDDETRQIVAEKYAKDIEYFGYEFGE